MPVNEQVKVHISVVDPDLYVFGPLGSGSVIICTGPDPSINKQKKQDTRRIQVD